MDAQGTLDEDEATQSPAVPPASRGPGLTRVLKLLDFKNISAVYLWIVLFVIFAIWTPGNFLTLGTLRSMADQQAVTTILALGLVVSLAAGVFDLSVGLTLGASNVTVAWAVTYAHLPVGLALLLGVVIGACVGLINAFLVVQLGISSFIATLASSSVLTAYATWRSNDQQTEITNSTFTKFSDYLILGLPWTFWVMIVIAIALWYVLRYRPVGRFLYATGGGREAARLAGVRTDAVTVGALMTTATIAGLAGAILTLRIGLGTPTIGSPYLIPAFSAAFLGSTQLGRGRFNVWGTVIAVYALATGTKGLNLVGGPSWLPDLFNGIALAVAVSFSASAASSPIRTRLSRRRRLKSDAAVIVSTR